MNCRKIRKYMFVATALLGIPGHASADDVHCPPGLGAVTIDGNVLVAGDCVLDGTIVIGNVLMYAGGSIVARGAEIQGNLQASDAFEVDVADSRIGGNIQLDNLVGDRSRVADSSIDGSIQLKDNRSQLEIAGNLVVGDIQAFDNTGGIDISTNTVDGNLQCKSNNPPPTGGDNTVQGNKEDQCADLQSPAGTTGSGVAQSGLGSGSAVASDSGGGGAVGPWMIAFALILLGATIGRRKTT